MAAVARPRVVVCGSKANEHAISEAGRVLIDCGLDVLLPGRDLGEPSPASPREISRRHIARIRDDRTDALLAVNGGGPAELDYIGPHTLAEIAVAFHCHRRVFVLHGIPGCYAEELEAWGVQRLEGSLWRLVLALAGQA